MSATEPSHRALSIMDVYLILQWSAMAVTVAATWLVASRSKTRRHLGFWTFLLSNALWVVWGWHDHAIALVVLQFALAAMNIRGARKSE
jgi:hypothetical protein